MSDHAFRPRADAAGTMTAVNDTVTSSSKTSAISGAVLVISVGAEPIHIRFGKLSDTVTTSNGLRLPANGLLRLSVPSGSTNLHYIRAGASDSTISLQSGDSGI